MLHAMDTMNADTGHAPRSETEAERQARIAWEAEGIAEARADVAAGRLVDAAKVRAWVDSLRTDNPLPAPYSGR
jgi:predicted transcriptional regulator